MLIEWTEHHIKHQTQFSAPQRLLRRRRGGDDHPEGSSYRHISLFSFRCYHLDFCIYLTSEQCADRDVATSRSSK